LKKLPVVLRILFAATSTIASDQTENSTSTTNILCFLNSVGIFGEPESSAS